MRKSAEEIENLARSALTRKGVEANHAARFCAFLELVGYPGLQHLLEAMTDRDTHMTLAKDSLGVDLGHVSCVFLCASVDEMVKAHHRVYVRNVRHGLYLLPASVWGNYGIGCPVDAAFGLGGERLTNPYADKLAVAAGHAEIDPAIWEQFDR